MPLGEKRARGVGLAGTLMAGLAMLAAFAAVSPRLLASGDIEHLGDFVDQNLLLIDRWLRRAPGRDRDRRLQTYRENIQWAEGCRAGRNSDLELLARPLEADEDTP